MRVSKIRLWNHKVIKQVIDSWMIDLNLRTGTSCRTSTGTEKNGSQRIVHDHKEKQNVNLDKRRHLQSMTLSMLVDTQRKT
jgi:hypothetical protein